MRGVRGALRMRCALHRCGKFLDKKRTEDTKNLKFEYFFAELQVPDVHVRPSSSLRWAFFFLHIISVVFWKKGDL